MKHLIVLGIAAVLLADSASGQDSKKPPASDVAKAEHETRYLAFQIFTYGPNPKMAKMGEGTNPQPASFPDKATLRDYIDDIKQRIGSVGDRRNRLAVVLGHISFDHTDADVTEFIALGFELALETDVAVGFHIDDSMFWARRKDLWSDPQNVEALDWDGTPCTGRSLEWQTGPGAKADAAPPQMCFNSKLIQREVRQRSALLGKAIQSGVQQLQERKRPELYAGVIAGSETMLGQDFKTGKYLGYRALLNRAFSRARPPQDIDSERENVIQEFIELWTTGLADAGAPPQQIYSHTAFLPRRVFKLGDNKETYSQHNNFAPPSVAFGKHHRPGFSTYPAPGRFDEIYEELAKHKQASWASCEGTNLQLGSGPGQSGMNMETYLAKMFNHGATLVNVFSWGIGGPAMKDSNPFRIVTEGEEALQAYRKFLKGEPLIEAKTEALTMLERLPPKMQKIQKEFPAWMRQSGNKEAAALMQKLQEEMKAKNFEEVENAADSILKLMGVKVEPDAPNTAKEGSSYQERLPPKIQKLQKELPAWIEKGGDKVKATALMQKLDEQLKANNFEEAEKTADSILNLIGASTPIAASGIPEELLKRLRHDVGGSFLVSRDTVQEELKLTGEQKEKLEQHLRQFVPDAMQFFQKIEGLKPEERKKELSAFRSKAQDKLAAVLKETLDEGQRRRLRQLELQREGLRNGEIWKDLHISDEQRKQFMPLMLQAQIGTQLLLEKLQKSGKLKEIQPQVIKVRDDLEVKLEALLTEAQKKQWQEMLGKPMSLADLFDL